MTSSSRHCRYLGSCGLEQLDPEWNLRHDLLFKLKHLETTWLEFPWTYIHQGLYLPSHRRLGGGGGSMSSEVGANRRPVRVLVAPHCATATLTLVNNISIYITMPDTRQGIDGDVYYTTAKCIATSRLEADIPSHKNGTHENGGKIASVFPTGGAVSPRRVIPHLQGWNSVIG